MSSAGFGKARNTSYQMTDLIKVKRDIKLLYSLNRVKTPSQTVVPFITGTHPASAPPGYLGLNVQGGSMLGPIAFLPVYNISTISNTIDISKSGGGFSTFITLSIGTPTIKTITGAANDGQLLFIRGAGVTTVDNTGNIRPMGGASFTWLGEDIVAFLYLQLTQKWVQITAPSNASQNFTFGSPNISLNGMEYPVIIKNSGSYTIDSTNGAGSDYFIKMNDPSFARNVTLPDATLYKGRVITIKHAGSGFNVNVLTTAFQTIDGVASYTINTLYGGITVFSDGFNWLIESKVT